MKLSILVIILLSLFIVVGCSAKTKSSDNDQSNVVLVSSQKYKNISWDELLSEEELAYYINEMDQYNIDSGYQGGNPPPVGVNKKLHKKIIRIPGYPVAVDTVAGELHKAKTFILVPTAGACIHIPPPPENQTIFVEMKKAITLDPYIPVYIEGTIYIEEGNNDIAEFFYKIKGDKMYEYSS